MTVTVQRFLKSYPDFKSTDYQLVQQKLTEAIAGTNSGAFGDQADYAVMLKTAHLLSISPSGLGSRLHQYSEKTVYSVELNKMQRAAAVGLGRNS